MRIDRGIVPPLYQVPDPTINVYVDGPKPHHPFALPVRTLLRGARNRLPTGQEVAKRLKLDVLTQKSHCIGGILYDPWSELRELGWIDKTPLLGTTFSSRPRWEKMEQN